MRIANNSVDKIEFIGRTQGKENAFRDWCECMALSIANSCDLLHSETWKRREKRYLDITSRYDENPFPELFAQLVNAFENSPWEDHLGKIYMECFGGNKNMGQCFTPSSVCELCSSVVNVPTDNKESSLYEPACGGGAMIIAFLKKCHESGYDYQRKLFVEAADLDSLCVHMCYTQLSLLGTRAVVKIQDSLSRKLYDTFVTPFETLKFCV